MVGSVIVFVFHSCQQGCGLQNESLARISFAIITKGNSKTIVTPNYFVTFSDSVKRHLRGRHLSVLNLKFDFISDGGRTREKQIALSLKRHLFPHGGREPKAFGICFSQVRPPSEIKSNFKFKTLKRHLLKRHLTLSDISGRNGKGGDRWGS